MYNFSYALLKTKAVLTLVGIPVDEHYDIVQK